MSESKEDGYVFDFTLASVETPDCSKCLTDILSENNLTLFSETYWVTIEFYMMKLPIKRTFNLVDELYRSDRLSFPEGMEFVVESIRAKSVEKGILFYNVKWEGWPSTFNTWESESNLTNCSDAIEEFNKKCPKSGILEEVPYDKKLQIDELLDRLKEVLPHSEISPFEFLNMFVTSLPQYNGKSRPHKIPYYGTESDSLTLKRPAETSDIVPHIPKRFRFGPKCKAILESALTIFQRKLNDVYIGEAKIFVENTVDSECPPVDFQPIPDYVTGENVFLPTKSPVGCECLKNVPVEEPSPDAENRTPIEPCWFNRRRGCCAIRAGSVVPYNRNKRLTAPSGFPIYECNSTCLCGVSCPFRVVQLGRQVPLCIFRTRDRGWGVKTMKTIAKGTFVIEYLGEILTFDVAEQRGLIYDKQTMTYLFDLDFDGDAHYTVDASHMGNISHFINHSCDPNLTVRCVFIECLNPKLPRIALYASRNIRKGEELTFDYNMTGAVNGSGDNLVESREEAVAVDLVNKDDVETASAVSHEAASTESTVETFSEVVETQETHRLHLHLLNRTMDQMSFCISITITKPVPTRLILSIFCIHNRFVVPTSLIFLYFTAF